MGLNTVWSFLKAIVPILISSAALLIVFLDRRPRLKLKARSEAWYHLKPNSSRTYVVFMGTIEVYNLSARANAVRHYEIWCKNNVAPWEKMESDRYTLSSSSEGEEPKVYNHTPLTLAPYSGAEALVQGNIKMPRQPYEMEVKVVVEDLFGKHYLLIVKASS